MAVSTIRESNAERPENWSGKPQGAGIPSLSDGSSNRAEGKPSRTSIKPAAKGKKPGSSSNVRVRMSMTREGFHVVSLTLFILVGAVIRDVNLMVILAGALVGMLILQWRLSFRTLLGLRTFRNAPSNMMNRKPSIVEIRCTNPRRWLGAWFLTFQDSIQPIDRSGNKVEGEHTMTVMLPSIPPSSSQRISYELTLTQRGAYRFGPMKVATRFPFSLMQGRFVNPETNECLVHPTLGQILPLWKELLEVRRMGAQRTKSQSGANDGEFFGLRSYRIGDSPRWIHWRTSARKSELVVRQFERQENIQISLLLDLYADPRAIGEAKKKESEAVETAIEFAASLTNMIVGRGRGSVSVAIAASELTLFPRMQSRNQVEAFMNELSFTRASLSPDWLSASQSLCSQLRAHPLMLVVSTRADHWGARPSLASTNDEVVLQRSAVRWVNVANGELEPFFRRGAI